MAAGRCAGAVTGRESFSEARWRFVAGDESNHCTVERHVDSELGTEANNGSVDDVDFGAASGFDVLKHRGLAVAGGGESRMNRLQALLLIDVEPLGPVLPRRSSGSVHLREHAVAERGGELILGMRR